MRRLLGVSVAALVLVAAGCGDDDDASDASVNITQPTAPPTTATASVDLVGTTWEMTAIVTSSGTEAVPDGVDASLTFADDGTGAVDTGCNTGSASVSIDESQLQLSPIALTKMACEPEATSVETAIVALSMGPLDYDVAGDQLVLTSGANSLILTAAPT
jgi:heat shock protein HslJ